MQKIFPVLLLAALFLLSGCEQKAFTRVYDQNEIGAKIESVYISGDDREIFDKVEKAVKKKKIVIKQDSSYEIQFDFSYYAKRCNNPLVKSADTDFDGFIRLSLFKNKKKIYMCQRDFKGEVKQYMFNDLVDIMFEDMKIRI